MNKNLIKFLMTLLIFAVLVFYLINRKNSMTLNEEIHANCVKEYKETISGLVENIKISRTDVLIIMRSGRELPWRGSYKGFKNYIDSLSFYENTEKLKKMIKNDSIHKPKDSFDLFIYKNSRTDSLVHLKSNYNCSRILKKNRKRRE